MVDEAARQGKTIAKPNLSVGGFQAKVKMTDTTEVTAADGSKYFVYKGRVTALATVEPSAAEIAAMETLLADEYALETAFEGNRFFDLMRLQQHRNVAPARMSELRSMLIAVSLSRCTVALRFR